MLVRAAVGFGPDVTVHGKLMAHFVEDALSRPSAISGQSDSPPGIPDGWPTSSGLNGALCCSWVDIDYTTRYMNWLYGQAQGYAVKWVDRLSTATGLPALLFCFLCMIVQLLPGCWSNPAALNKCPT